MQKHCSLIIKEALFMLLGLTLIYSLKVVFIIHKQLIENMEQLAYLKVLQFIT